MAEEKGVSEGVRQQVSAAGLSINQQGEAARESLHFHAGAPFAQNPKLDNSGALR